MAVDWQYDDYASVQDYKNNIFNTKRFDLVESDLLRHMIVCNPYALDMRHPDDYEFYYRTLNNILNLDSFSVGSAQRNELRVKANLGKTETTFKTYHSFLLGMLFTSLVSERIFGVCPLNIRHVSQPRPYHIVFSNGKAGKVRPDFLGITMNGKICYIFDAKGSLRRNGGKVSNENIEHGGAQVGAVNAVEDTVHPGVKFTGSNVKRFVGAVSCEASKDTLNMSVVRVDQRRQSRSSSKSRAQSLQTLIKKGFDTTANSENSYVQFKNEKKAVFKVNMIEALKKHYQILKHDEIQIGKVRYVGTEIKSSRYWIGFPKDYQEYYLGSNNKVKEFPTHELEKIFTEKTKNYEGRAYSLGKDGVVVLPTDTVK